MSTAPVTKSVHFGGKCHILPLPLASESHKSLFKPVSVHLCGLDMPCALPVKVGIPVGLVDVTRVWSLTCDENVDLDLAIIVDKLSTLVHHSVEVNVYDLPVIDEKACLTKVNRSEREGNRAASLHNQRKILVPGVLLIEVEEVAGVYVKC